MLIPEGDRSMSNRERNSGGDGAYPIPGFHPRTAVREIGTWWIRTISCIGSEVQDTYMCVCWVRNWLTGLIAIFDVFPAMQNNIWSKCVYSGLAVIVSPTNNTIKVAHVKALNRRSVGSWKASRRSRDMMAARLDSAIRLKLACRRARCCAATAHTDCSNSLS